MFMENTLTSIYTTLDNDSGNPKTQHLQANIPHLWTRIADLTDKIGVGQFAFDSHISLSLAQKKNQPLRVSNIPNNKKRKSNHKNDLPLPWRHHHTMQRTQWSLKRRQVLPQPIIHGDKTIQCINSPPTSIPLLPYPSRVLYTSHLSPIWLQIILTRHHKETETNFNHITRSCHCQGLINKSLPKEK